MCVISIGDSQIIESSEVGEESRETYVPFSLIRVFGPPISPDTVYITVNIFLAIVTELFGMALCGVLTSSIVY